MRVLEEMKTQIPRQMYASCPVCASGDLQGIWQVSGYPIARCQGCSLVFVQAQVTAQELDAHYATAGDVAYDDTNVECLNYYYQKLGELISRRFAQPGRILDIGCSRGWFLDVMKGWECYGSEIVPADAEAARVRYGERIVRGSFEAYPLRDSYFDVITLQDVFDHFRDPLPALEKCRRMLKPGGLIAIKVHNISCWYAKLTGANFYAVVPPSHLFYYDRQTLSLALEKSGFSVVDTRYIGNLLKVKTVFWRLSRGGDKSSRYYRIYKMLDGTALGRFTFVKNLHDIITVFAEKAA
jgi:SAM-dependent methyltransferase